MTPTMKHAFGRIASRYDPADGLARMLADPEFLSLFPDAKACRGGTAIDFGDGNPVDVLVPVRPVADRQWGVCGYCGSVRESVAENCRNCGAA